MEKEINDAGRSTSNRRKIFHTQMRYLKGINWLNDEAILEYLFV